MPNPIGLGFALLQQDPDSPSSWMQIENGSVSSVGGATSSRASSTEILAATIAAMLARIIALEEEVAALKSAAPGRKKNQDTQPCFFLPGYFGKRPRFVSFGLCFVFIFLVM